MPSAVTKFSDSPLRFANEAFERLIVHGGKRIDEVLKHVLDACKNEILAGGMLRQLPFLTESNLSAMQSGSLVRYRCMIQDMHEPEYFQSLYSTADLSKPGTEQLHCGLWRESLEIPDGHEYCEEGPRNETSERHVFVGSSIPAETHWARHYYSESATATGDDGVGQVPVGQCLLKVYDDGDKLKLNEVIEFIGLYYSPEHVAQESQEDDDIPVSGVENLAIRQQANMPTQLPCLHVFHFEKLVHHHPELTLPNGKCEEQQARSHLVRSLAGNVPGFRARLVNAFTECLFKGDELVSEYFLCHLMSAIYTKDMGTAVGHFALNIFNVHAKEFGSDWMENCLRPFLNHLLTQVSYLPLSMPTLNGCPLVSRKCYETNRLVSGRLQLPKGTELIIDETKLEAGQLDTQGVRNMAALRGMIKWQKLDYDFGFNACEFSTDMRTLIISEGPSILSSDFAIPIRPQLSDTAAIPNDKGFPILEDGEFVNAARVYFALAPTLAFTIDNVMQTRIQEDFVAMRRASGSVITADYLHRLLSVARMQSLSSGDSRLRQEIWEKAKQMETERLERLKK